MSTLTPDYKVYTREVVESRFEDEAGGVILEVEYKGAKAFLRFQRFYLRIGHHIDFYAADHSWCALTTTGYRSYFIGRQDFEDWESFDIEDVNVWFSHVCEAVFSIPDTLQTSLF